MRTWLIAPLLPTVHAAALAIEEPDHEVLRRLDGTEGGRRLEMPAPVTRSAALVMLEVDAPAMRRLRRYGRNGCAS